MGRYVIRRLVQVVLVMVGATLVLFVCLFVIPGNPVASLAGRDRARDPTVVKELEHRYSLDQPLVVQYGRYVSGLVRGDLGTSFQLQRPVSAILAEKVANTAKLALVAFGIEIVFGIGAGVVWVVARRSFGVAMAFTTALTLGVPAFVIGLLLQERLALRWGLLPLSGQGDGLRSYVLPAATLAAFDSAFVARLMRGSMSEVMTSDFVRAAEAKGASRRSVVLRHALPNAVIPVLTYLGLAFGSILGGALIVEAIFNWDGVGLATVSAIQTHDNPVVLGLVVCGVAAFLVVNLVVDIVCAFVDPRIRLG